MSLLIKLKQRLEWAIPAALLLVSLQMISMPSHAAGLLTPSSGNFEPLEISEHHIDVLVENGYAVTTVTQIFYNSHNIDLEAIYSFPVPTQAAVSEFSVWIDDQQVIGEVLEKKKAKTIYQQEKIAGNEVGLTVQNGYKTFETSVSPVRAGKSTKIQIRYYQLANIDLGIGRWIYQLEDGGVDEEALSFWNTNSQVSKAFSFNLTLRSSYPIDAVRLPHHPQAKVTQISQGEWKVSLIKNGASSVNPQINDNIIEQTMAQEMEQTYLEAHALKESQQPSTNHNNTFNLNQDIVVYWRHQQGLPGSIDLVTYRANENSQGTFMMTFTPGEELSAITTGTDWIFILDISGSMQGKFSSLVEGVSQSIKKMKPYDRIKIILFNNIATEITRGYQNATPENIQYLLSKLQKISPDNGTNLYAGLKYGLSSLDTDRATGIILVTDGVANVGHTEKKHFFKLLEKNDVRLFTFIMGNSVNQPMLEPLARRSGGFALNISNADDIVGRVIQATDKLSHNAFHDVEIKINGMTSEAQNKTMSNTMNEIKVSDLTPQQLGSLYRGQQLIVMGHYWQSGDAQVTLTATISGQKKTFSSNIHFPKISRSNPEIERLWAYAKISDLDERMQDFANEDHQQAITEIALEHSLVTNYTSMLVLREEQFQAYNIKRRNKNRVDIESKARQSKSQQPIKNNRVDSQKPAFKKARPSSNGNGGGSLYWLLILLLAVSLVYKRTLVSS